MSKTGHTGGQVLLALGVLLAVLFILSFRLGQYGTDVGTTCRTLFSRLLLLEQTWTGSKYTAILNICLPRIALTCLVGCYLSNAGAAYQGVFRNPMASPDVLGVSSDVSFGAALVIPTGLGNQGTVLSALSRSLTAVVLIYLAGQWALGDRVLSLVLASMVISSLFTVATSYLELVADPINQLPKITYWLMSSLSGTRLVNIARVLPTMAAGLSPLFLLRWKLNLLTLGGDEVRAMGVNTPRLCSLMVVYATLVTAAPTAVSGTIGWMGLIVPHPCRRLVGSNSKILPSCSMLVRAASPLLIDNLSRNLLATEIPIGILTAFTDVSFFLYLMLWKRGAR